MTIYINGVPVEVSGGEKIQAGDGIHIEDQTVSVALPTKYVTQAEYDALPDEQKQSDAVYIVDEPPWTPVPLSIQEYDTEDGWHVRKWSDGYVEMIYRKYNVVVHTENFMNGSIVIFDTFAYPFILKEKYSENFSILSCDNFGNAKYPVVYELSNGEKTNKWALFLYVPNITIKINFSIVVAGRWK